METASTDHCVEFCLKGKQRQHDRWKKSSLYTGENDRVEIKIIAVAGEGGPLVECSTTAERMGSGPGGEGSAWPML